MRLRRKRVAKENPDEGPQRQGSVWLTLARKYRVAQYESLSIDLGASTSIDPGETHREATKRLFADLSEEFADVLEVMREQEKI